MQSVSGIHPSRSCGRLALTLILLMLTVVEGLVPIFDAPYVELISQRSVFQGVSYASIHRKSYDTTEQKTTTSQHLRQKQHGSPEDEQVNAVIPTGWGSLPYATVYQLVPFLGGILVTDTGAYFNQTTEISLPIAPDSSFRFISGPYTGIVAAYNATHIMQLSCNFPNDRATSSSQKHTQQSDTLESDENYDLNRFHASADPSCTIGATIALPWVGVQSSVAYQVDGGAYAIWVSTNTTTAVFLLGQTFKLVMSLNMACSSLAYSGVLDIVACGNSALVTLYNADVSSNSTAASIFIRSEWVTDVANGDGGVYDDVVTSMAFDDCGYSRSQSMPTTRRTAPYSIYQYTGTDSTLCGSLYVGNPTALNVRYPNGSVIRLAGVQGLPYSNITSVAIDTSTVYPDITPSNAGNTLSNTDMNPIRGYTNLSRIWIGTSAGAMLFDPLASSTNDVITQSDPTNNNVTPLLMQRWRYLNGPRWVPVPPSNISFAAVQQISCHGNSAFIVTDAGTAVLTAQLWTLQQKAAWYETTILPRHDRLQLGLVADCQLGSFGNTDDCINAPNESNGIWTGIQTAAEAFRYAVTGSPDARAAALHFASGMQLLINITGDASFPSRSVCTPQEVVPAGGQWIKSPLPQYAGWYYQGNTSSDSVTGHMFAYAMFSTAASDLVSNAINTSNLLLNVNEGIIRNNYTLVQPDGSGTRWGIWTPEILNYNRDWSDGRGVNSMQMLSYLIAALGLSTNPQAASIAALENLLAPKNDYAGNIVNVKIEAPSDDNFSDDELTFLPYATACAFPDVIAAWGSNNTYASALPMALQASLQRTFAYVRTFRPSLWSVIYLSCAANINMPAIAGDSALTDLWWNLATWPLESIDWPLVNSHRMDVVFNPEPNRNGQYNTESRVVLPANERGQYRWNADVLQLDSGGTGMDEFEPGAFLLPYWMARAYNLIVS